jgi:hypothetical protein
MSIRGAWSVSDAVQRAKRHGWNVICGWQRGYVLLHHRSTLWGLHILYDAIPGTGIVLRSIERV